MNRGICLLLMGRYEQGWRDYHARWDFPEFTDRNDQILGPIWIGSESIQGKRILLQSEQGLGDTNPVLPLRETRCGPGSRGTAERPAASPE